MQKRTIATVAALAMASLLLTGCGLAKSYLQGKVNDVNKGISDTTKDLGKQLGGGQAATGVTATGTTASGTTTTTETDKK